MNLHTTAAIAVVVDAPAASAASVRNAARAVPVVRDLKALAAQAGLALVVGLVPAVRVAPVVIVVVAGQVLAVRAGMTVAVRVAKSVRHRSRCPR